MIYRQIHNHQEDRTYRDKDSGTVLQYLSKKQFNTIEKDDSMEILGFIRLNRNCEGEGVFIAGDGKYSVYPLDQKRRGRLDGYVKTSAEDGSIGYLEVRRGWGPVIIFSIVAFLLVMGIIWTLQALMAENDYGGVIYNPKEMTKQQKEEVEKQIEFPGFSDTTLTEESPAMTFGNPEKNEVTFEYVMLNNRGEMLYRTEHMAPGSGLNVNMAELLGRGKHNLKIRVNTYSIKDGKPRNNMEFNIKVTVK